ncbi:MAG: hypothetical protein KDB69_10730, partial [Acidimicrobiia bacterium]|nr:hypothetical protein [Acidimicrobiia bacterium]
MEPSPIEDAGNVTLPLRDRIPEYLAVFGVGFAAATLVGLLVSLIWDVKVASGVGYTIVALGVILLLAGGASGGGYTSLGIGAAGALFGTRRT